MKGDYVFSVADDLLNGTTRSIPKTNKKKLPYSGIKVGRLRPVKSQVAAVQIDRKLNESLWRLGESPEKLPQLLLYRMAFMEILDIINPIFQGILNKIKQGYEQCLVHQFEKDMSELNFVIFEKEKTIKKLEKSLEKRKREIGSLELDIINLKRKKVESVTSTCRVENTTPHRENSFVSDAQQPEETTSGSNQMKEPLNVTEITVVEPSCNSPSSCVSPTSWLSEIIDTSIVLEGLGDG